MAINAYIVINAVGLLYKDWQLDGMAFIKMKYLSIYRGNTPLNSSQWPAEAETYEVIPFIFSLVEHYAFYSQIFELKIGKWSQ